VGGQPLLHRFGFVDFIVIHHHVEPRIPFRWIARVETGQQVKEPRCANVMWTDLG
jgi:hypothetical protein